MVETLDEYAWSSHRGYLSSVKNWKWLHKDFILSMLASDKKREDCCVYGVEEKDLLTAQRGESNELRNVAIYLCRVLRNDTLLELGLPFTQKQALTCYFLFEFRLMGKG